MSIHPLQSLSAANTQFMNQSQSQPSLSKSVTVCNWCGWAVTHALSATARDLTTLLNTALKILSVVFEDSLRTAFLCRKLDKHILAMLQQWALVSPDCFKRFSNSLKSAIGVLSFAQIPVDISYFARGKYRKDSRTQLFGRIALTASNIGFTLIWLKEKGFADLAKITTYISEIRPFSFVPSLIPSVPLIRLPAYMQKIVFEIGQVRVFSCVKQLSLPTFSRTMFGLGYLFFAAETYQKIVQGVRENDRTRLTFSALEGCYIASELVIEGALLANYTNALGLGLLAATSVTMALANFVYIATHKQIKIK